MHPLPALRQETFGPYDLCEELGDGAVTTVVRAIERESGRVVALKRLQAQFAADPPHIRQFLREARLTQALHHPNIVRVFDVGQVGGVHYMSMEWVPGQSLELLVDEDNSGPRIPVGVAIWILRQILGALTYMTTGLDESLRPMGIIHRDISPSNLMITPEGDLKVLDFGMARSLAGRYATNSGVARGTPGYMAPELLAGREADLRSDMYSAAILGWELLTSRRLFAGSEIEQEEKRESHRYVAPSKLGVGISRELDDLLAVALSEDPQARWPGAASMAAALDVVIRRYGRAAGPEAWISWQQGQGELSSLAMHGADTTDENNIGGMTTLLARPARSTPRMGASRFGPNSQTDLDPIADPQERHLRVSSNED